MARGAAGTRLQGQTLYLDAPLRNTPKVHRKNLLRRLPPGRFCCTQIGSGHMVTVKGARKERTSHSSPCGRTLKEACSCLSIPTRTPTPACCPGTISGNALDGLQEKVCVQVKRVYDSCLQQEQLDDKERHHHQLCAGGQLRLRHAAADDSDNHGNRGPDVRARAAHHLRKLPLHYHGRYHPRPDGRTSVRPSLLRPGPLPRSTCRSTSCSWTVAAWSTSARV